MVQIYALGFRVLVVCLLFTLFMLCICCRWPFCLLVESGQVRPLQYKNQVPAGLLLY